MDKELDIILEAESDMPADWKSNTVLMRDGKGNVIEVEVPDDMEG